MKIVLFTVAALVLTGCMTDNEAWLRNRDIDIKAAHPATYQPKPRLRRKENSND